MPTEGGVGWFGAIFKDDLLYPVFRTASLPMIVVSLSQSRYPLFYSPWESTSSFLPVLGNGICLLAQSGKRFGKFTASQTFNQASFFKLRCNIHKVHNFKYIDYANYIYSYIYSCIYVYSIYIYIGS